MGKHALLSASASHKWLNCPPSARLCESYEDQTSSFAAEGTDAHSLCEYKLKKALGMNVKDPTPNLTYFNTEMDECASAYTAFIFEQLETAKQSCSDPQVLIEQRLDYSKYVKDGFGTGDCVIIADGTLHIIDYKHGAGVLVEAEENPQMKLYALGALLLFDGIYDISTVSMTIFQPRRENISTHTVFKESLYQWAEDILRPTALLAFAGEGDFKCGEWCQFCKAKAQCRERANANLELAKYDFLEPALLDNEEIAQILKQVDNLISWAGDVKDYALSEALKGVQFTGFKIVEGRSNRKISDDFEAAKKLIDAGFKDIYKPKELLGIVALEKLCGVDNLSMTLGTLISKPQGKPTLVPESDKRKPMNTAADDFADTNNI